MGQCAPEQYQVGLACRADLAPGCVVSNVVFRYNVFIGGSLGLSVRSRQVGHTARSATSASSATSSARPSPAAVPGISYDSNTFLNGVATCGTNATSLGAGDPFVQSSMATSQQQLVGGLATERASGRVACPTVDQRRAAAPTSILVLTPTVLPGPARPALERTASAGGISVHPRSRAATRVSLRAQLGSLAENDARVCISSPRSGFSTAFRTRSARIESARPRGTRLKESPLPVRTYSCTRASSTGR